MLIVTYWHRGPAHADDAAENVVRSAVIDGKVSIITSTLNVIDAARCLMAEGVIPFDQFEVRFRRPSDDFEITIPHRPNGQLETWPTDFGGHTQNWLGRMASRNRRKT